MGTGLAQSCVQLREHDIDDNMTSLSIPTFITSIYEVNRRFSLCLLAVYLHTFFHTICFTRPLLNVL